MISIQHTWRTCTWRTAHSCRTRVVDDTVPRSVTCIVTCIKAPGYFAMPRHFSTSWPRVTCIPVLGVRPCNGSRCTFPTEQPLPADTRLFCHAKESWHLASPRHAGISPRQGTLEFRHANAPWHFTTPRHSWLSPPDQLLSTALGAAFGVVLGSFP